MNEPRGTILFIDDNRYEMLPLVEALEDAGYRVVFVTSPAEADKTLGSGTKPDLIICDLMMISEDDNSLDDSRQAGVRFARDYRERLKSSGCPILVLTGVLDKNAREAASKVCTEVLRKPIDPDVLIDKVNEVGGRKKRAGQPR